MRTVLALVLIIFSPPPREYVVVELVIFRPLSSLVWEERLVGSCRTEPDGRCLIRARVQLWADGLARGELRWKGEARPLIWPGEEEIAVLLNSPAGERPYEYLEQQEQAPYTTSHSVTWPLLVLAILTFVFSVIMAQKGKGRQ